MDIGYNNSADNIWLSDDSFVTWDPLCQHGLSLMPALIGNYIHYKVWDEITQISTVEPLKFGNR